MASLGRLTIDMVANIGGFERDMGKADRVTRQTMRRISRDLDRAERDASRAAASIRNLGLQLAAVSAVAVAGVARELRNMAAEADRLDKLSRATGVTVENLQRLGFAAEQSGSDLETVARSITQLQRNIQGAADGLSTYTRAFERIGVSVQDLQGLRPEQQFELIAQALSQVGDEGVRNATALELFGRAGRELLPLLAQGADGIRELGDQFTATGATISTQAARDFARFNDELNLLRQQAEAVRVSILSDLIKPLADFVQFLNTERGTAAMREALEAMRRVLTVVGGIIAGRFLVQLGAASVALVTASVNVIRLTAAKVALGGASVTAARSIGALRLAVSTLLGPVGIAVAAIASIAPAVLSMRNEFRNSSQDIDRFGRRLDESRRSMERFSDAHIRMLNQMQQMPGNVADLRTELEEAETQLRRFTRQYGENSVAARSAADRVEQLKEQLALMGVQTEQAVVGARNLAKAIGEHLRDAVKAAEKAWRDAQIAGDNFNKRVEDLAATLQGPLAVAVRRHNLDMEEMNRLLAINAISAEEAARASAVFASRLEREFKRAANSVIDLQMRMMELFMFGGSGSATGAVSAAGQLASSLSLAISGSQGQSLGESIGNSIKTFGMSGIQEGLQEALTEAFKGMDLEGPEMQIAFLAIGEAIGGNVGAAVGTAIGASIGAALGGPIGMQIGAMIGNAVGSLFDREKDPILQSAGRFGFSRDPEEARRRGDFVETDLGEMFFRFRNVSEEAAGTLKRALRQFDGVMADILGEEFLTQASALLDGFRSDSQDMGTIIQQRFDLIVSVVDGFAREIALSGNTLEEQMQNLVDVFRLRNLAGIGDDMGFANADDPILLASQLARAGETIGQAFERLLTITTSLDRAMALTGNTIEGGRDGVVRFGDALVKAFGDDLNRLTEGLNRVFGAFFDEDELIEQQIAEARQRASDLFGALGIEVTDALFTQGGFRELFDDLFGNLDADATAQLIEAGVAIADLIDAEERLAELRGEETEAVENLGDILREREGLERRLLQLQGDTAALRELELAALDPSNRELLERIFALEDEAQAAREAADAERELAAERERIANETQALERRILDLTGDTAAIRELELAAVDESNRALLLRIFALEDEAAAAAEQAAAAQEAARIAQQRASIERQILTLQGNTVALRALELAALDESNRALMMRVYALEDEAERLRIMQSINESLALDPLNDFQRSLVEIRRQLLRNVQALSQNARLTGNRAQIEHDLARAHAAAAAAAVRAIAQLEDSTRQLVGQVFGTPLDDINRQISELEAQGAGAADSLSRVGDELSKLIDFADSLLIGNLSPLGSRDRLAEARRQLNAAVANGDAGQIQSLAQQVLQIGRERFASGSQFADLFNDVQAILRAAGASGGGSVQEVAVSSAPALEALFAERDRLQAEEAERNRRALSLDIAQNVADLAGATGDSFAEVAERLGFDLEALAEILGFDIEGLGEYLQGLQVDTQDIADRLEGVGESISESIREFSDRSVPVQEETRDSTRAIEQAVRELIVAVRDQSAGEGRSLRTRAGIAP